MCQRTTTSQPSNTAQSQILCWRSLPRAYPRDPQNENMTEDFATALESFEQEQAELAANEDRVLKGTVVSINSNYLVVDIGLKSEGVVPLEEAKDHDGNMKFQPGDAIDVMVEKGHTEEGYVNLSFQKAQRLHAWDEIEKAHNDKASVKARVIDRIKGGLTVDILGARAFLPGSQVDVRPVRNLDGLKGQELEVRVIKVNKKRGNIVVSRKQILDEEADRQARRHDDPPGRERRPDRHGEEPDRLRRVCRSGRHRRPAAYHRYELGPV